MYIKKLFLALFVLGLLVSPMAAKAITLDDLAAQISSLQLEISGLKNQLIAQVRNYTLPLAEPTAITPVKTASNVVAVISPNGGETLEIGQTYSIKWSGSMQQMRLLPINSYGNIDYNQNNISIVSHYNVPDTSGIYSWTIPNTVPVGKYYLQIEGCCGETGGFDNSNYYFSIIKSSIISATPLPVTPVKISSGDVTVNFPNGGETYYFGTLPTGNPLSMKAQVNSSKIGTFGVYLVDNPSTTNPGNKYPMSVAGGFNATINNIHSFSVGLINGYPPYNPGQYYMMAEWKSDDGTEHFIDFSDSYFKIFGSTPVSTTATPKIMYWWGKVNGHIDLTTGSWVTDPDGVSGANLGKLSYCQKWYPATTSVKDSILETASFWKNRGNVDGPFTSTNISYECVQEQIVTPTPACAPNDPPIT
ncbi:MAG: hypothetical protein US50_C0040G0011, partial [Candidatus Nomurabacteria bacterium GW2011_GWB1_37_5]